MEGHILKLVLCFVIFIYCLYLLFEINCKPGSLYEPNGFGKDGDKKIIYFVIYKEKNKIICKDFDNPDDIYYFNSKLFILTHRKIY